MGYTAVPFKVPGARGLEIIRSAIANGSYTCSNPKDRQHAVKQHVDGYLRRDTAAGSMVFYPSDRALALLSYIEERETARAAEERELATSNRQALVTIGDLSANEEIVSRADASDLVQTVIRASKLLDDGDVIAAKHLASGAYLDAKARAQYAATFGEAGRRVVAKARQLQGDALLIETRAKIQMANAYDAAQAEGRAARGRPKSIPDGNTFTQAEVGLTAKEIHDARKLAAAEEKAPGLVARAIQARLEAGLEPSRANLRAAVGTATATKEERGHNLYETPPEAMWVLLGREDFTATVWEPACGKGAIARMLEAAHYGVILSDLVDYETADNSGELQKQIDFLETQGDEDGASSFDIVTNPPYGQVLNAFVAHALRVHRPRKMALLLNVNFFGGTEDPDRNFAMDVARPARVYWFSRRLPMMHRDGWDGNEASSRMNTAWFVWELQEDGSYGDQTVIERVDWRDFVPASAESEAA